MGSVTTTEKNGCHKLLDEANAIGLEVRAEGDLLRFKGADTLEKRRLRDELARSKPAVMRILKGEPDPPDECELPLAEGAVTFRPVLIDVSQVETKQVSWLWQNRIAIGKLNLISGDPGIGKSLLTMNITAIVSHGLAWPDDADCAPCGGVVILSAEDDVEDTIRPRLEATQADLTQIRVLKAIETKDKTGTVERCVDLSRDIPHLETAVNSTQDCRLVIVDPITAYLGDKRMNDGGDIRSLMAELARFAADHDVAVLAVSHLRKGDGTAMYRTMGSLAFVAAVRTAWVVGRDRNDSSLVVFAEQKNNLAPHQPSLGYRIQPTPQGPVVQWEPGTVEASADELLNSKHDGSDSSALDEAVQWLTEEIADGPVPSKEVRSRAERDGIAKRTLDRAKQQLSVKSTRVGERWMWLIEEPTSPTSPTFP